MEELALLCLEMHFILESAYSTHQAVIIYSQKVVKIPDVMQGNSLHGVHGVSTR